MPCLHFAGFVDQNRFEIVIWNNDIKLVLNEPEWPPWYFRINFVSFKASRGPLFPKPVSWLRLFCHFLQQTGSNSFWVSFSYEGELERIERKSKTQNRTHRPMLSRDQLEAEKSRNLPKNLRKPSRTYQSQHQQPDLRQVVGLRNTLTCCVLPRQSYGKL